MGSRHIQQADKAYVFASEPNQKFEKYTFDSIIELLCADNAVVNPIQQRLSNLLDHFSQDDIEEDAEMAPPISEPNFRPAMSQGNYIGHSHQVVNDYASSQVYPSRPVQSEAKFTGHVPIAQSHLPSKGQNVPDNQSSLIRDNDIPPELRLGQFDILLLYAEQDKLNALKFKGLLERTILIDGGAPRICVLDKDLPSVTSRFDHMDAAVERSTFMFLFMTEVFCKDSWASMQKDEVLMTSIENPEKKWSVVPLFLENRRNLGYSLPFGIRGLKGIDVWLMLKKRRLSEIDVDQMKREDLDRFIIENITAMLTCRISLRRKREKVDELKLKEWRLNELMRLRKEKLQEQELDRKLREQEALMKQLSSELEVVTQTPAHSTQPTHTQPAERQVEGPSNIILNISKVQTLQIGNDNLFCLHGGENSDYDDDNSFSSSASHSLELGAVQTSRTGQVRIESQVSTDCGPGDTGLKQHSVVSSSCSSRGSSEDEETDILKPACGSCTATTAKQFGINVCHDASSTDDDVELMKHSGCGQTMYSADNSMADEDTDLFKPNRLAGPSGDQPVISHSKQCTMRADRC